MILSCQIVKFGNEVNIAKNKISPFMSMRMDMNAYRIFCVD